MLRDGRQLSVFNIAWGYDEGEAYAHVTTNVSPSVSGESVEVFVTDEVVRAQDETGELIYREQ
jgi:hypothetical protein